MAALDRVGARATVALNAAVCDVYPAVIRAGVERGWEWMGHGFTNSQLLAGLDEAQERAVITGVVDRIAAATGARPQGWLGPGLHETVNTPRCWRRPAWSTSPTGWPTTGLFGCGRGRARWWAFLTPSRSTTSAATCA